MLFYTILLMKELMACGTKPPCWRPKHGGFVPRKWLAATGLLFVNTVKRNVYSCAVAV